MASSLFTNFVLKNNYLPSFFRQLMWDIVTKHCLQSSDYLDEYVYNCIFARNNSNYWPWPAELSQLDDSGSVKIFRGSQMQIRQP